MEITKQNIINAAILIFSDDQSAALETVAEKAGVTRRTLHRYFKDRDDLLLHCAREMQKTCMEASKQAMESSDEPLQQLEQLLYAGINCGSKFVFLQKMHQHPRHHHNHDDPNCAEYDSTQNRIIKVINGLQDSGSINRNLTIGWMLSFFTGVVTASVNAQAIGSVAPNDIKKFAWLSYSGGIGISSASVS